ncbi:MAG: DNA recombination protein RmuC [Planctomycetota bacterium]
MDILLVVMAAAVGLAAGVGLARWQAAGQAVRTRRELEQLREELAVAQRARDAVAAGFDAWKASTEEQRRAEATVHEELRAAFAKLSQEALAKNAEAFLTLAKTHDDAHKKSLTEMLTPFKEQLTKLDTGTRELESKREKAYGALQEQVADLKTSTQALRVQSEALRTALRSDTRARGRWGEVALRNLVEYAGMVEHCSFSEQVTVDGGGRPDMVINLPGGDGRIPIDAKVPMDAYMEGIEADDPDLRRAHFLKHAEDLRGHVRTLASRDYAQALGTRVDFTVMFVPADPVLAVAHEFRPDLQQEAMGLGVLLTTPVTLLALLRTVALYWRQAEMARNAQQYWDTAREFHKRVTVFAEHFERVGKGLAGALDSYDKAVGSYQSRILPQAQKLEELDRLSGTERRLPDVPSVSRVPRDLPAAGGASGPDAGTEPEAADEAEAS